MSTAITADPFYAPEPSDDNDDDDTSADESMPGLVLRYVAVPPLSEQQQQQPRPMHPPGAPIVELVYDSPPPLEPDPDDYDGYSSDGSMPALIPRTQMWSESSSSDDDSDGVPPLIERRGVAAVVHANMFQWMLPSWHPASMYEGPYFRSNPRGRYDTESDDGCSDGGPRDCDSLEGFQAAEHTVKVLDYGDYDDVEYDDYEGEISEVDGDADDEAEEEEEERVNVKLPAVGEFFPQVEGNPYPLPVPEDSARNGPQRYAPGTHGNGAGFGGHCKF